MVSNLRFVYNFRKLYFLRHDGNIFIKPLQTLVNQINIFYKFLFKIFNKTYMNVNFYNLCNF